MTSKSKTCKSNKQEKCPSMKCKSCYGLLSKLEGKWEGTGMAVTFLPYYNKKDFAARLAAGKKIRPYRFLVHSTKETFNFKKIEDPIPNRGRLISTKPLKGQKDINLRELRYDQVVYDRATGNVVHDECGTFINEPATHVLPRQGVTIARMGEVLHGNVFMASSKFLDKSKTGPQIDDISIKPIGPGVDEPGFLNPVLEAKVPEGIKAKDVQNPNRLLRRALKGLNIRETTTIVLSTDSEDGSGGGIVNSRYVKENADTKKVEAIFWIIRVRNKDGSSSLLFQYTQTVMFEFNGKKWPHVAVGTLRKVEE